MGVVYKISFPTGEFYIGHTIRAIRVRIANHLTDPTNKNKMRLIRKFKLDTLEALLKVTKILYCGDDSKDIEKAILSDNRHNDYCVNGIFPKHRPKLKNNICNITIKNEIWENQKK